MMMKSGEMYMKSIGQIILFLHGHDFYPILSNTQLEKVVGRTLKTNVAENGNAV